MLFMMPINGHFFVSFRIASQKHLAQLITSSFFNFWVFQLPFYLQNLPASAGDLSPEAATTEPTCRYS